MTQKGVSYSGPRLLLSLLSVSQGSSRLHKRHSHHKFCLLTGPKQGISDGSLWNCESERILPVSRIYPSKAELTQHEGGNESKASSPFRNQHCNSKNLSSWIPCCIHKVLLQRWICFLLYHRDCGFPLRCILFTFALPEAKTVPM